MYRYIITGPECSGKTTLASSLGQLINAPVIEETARQWLSERTGHYSLPDVLHMAALHYHNMMEGSFSAAGLQICDTGMLEFIIWLQDKFKHTDDNLVRKFNLLPVNLYLLCVPEMPWTPDSLREDPNRREELFEQYKQYLRNAGKPFNIIFGSRDERLRMALSLIRNDLGSPDLFL